MKLLKQRDSWDTAGNAARTKVLTQGQGPLIITYILVVFVHSRAGGPTECIYVYIYIYLHIIRHFAVLQSSIGINLASGMYCM